ncbi:conjugal transfer protein TraH [Duganella sp. FT92W]|uniref:Conjugal transfer protein TraH n=1 Tax=Pseudoduganella rivuli TaxID=2666085 RepID=A0A7X2IIS9_9BURK|nr:conjugal transfer protein TraH [Pseudoduganella rivuli]MRV70585.1 conjugal transfer protein TraH [Pseudoduganella rivuli]
MKFETKLLELIACMAMSIPLNSIAGDLNAETNTMFSNLGTIGNYTKPGAFRGQVFNTYSGGSLMLRAPNKTYQLLSIELPEAHGGCGGIDAFGGAFSHISSAELKNMLKNITAALPGIAFQIALDTVSPLLGSISSRFHQLAEMINGQNKNSCALATTLVRNAAEATNFSTNKACQDIAVTLGIASDYADAEGRCKTDKRSILDTAKTSSDAGVRTKVPFVGNLTWQALKMTGSRLDDQEREMIMSMIGTVIFYETRDPNPIAPTLTSISHLLYGQSDAGSGAVHLQMLKCNNYVTCDAVTVNESYKHIPFTERVARMMRSISEKILTRTPIPNNSAEVGFVNQTSEPVYRMLSIAAISNSNNLTEDLIGRFRDVIAADYAYVFLDKNLRLGMNALDKDYMLDRNQLDSVRNIRSRALAILAQLGREKTLLYQRVGSVSAVSSQIEQLERQLRSTMPQHVLDLLGRQAAYLR